MEEKPGTANPFTTVLQPDRFGRSLNIYLQADSEMTVLASEQPDKGACLVHSAINAVLLNIGLVIVFFDMPLLGFSLFCVLGLLTFAAILVIEAATHAAAKMVGGGGSYWAQLGITNTYLMPIFAVFLLFFLVSPVLPFDIRIGLDLISFPVVIYMNDKKIRAVHRITQPLLPDLVYAGAAIIAYAYGFWIGIMLALVVGLGLTGGY